MKRIVKKTAAALLAFTLTAAVFSGCGSTASSAASADATAESTSAASAEGNWKRLRPPASWSSASRVPTRRSPTTMTAAS